MGSNWNWVWKPDIPPKVRTFIWSCMSSSLPVKSNLIRRRLGTNSLCNRCNSEDENTMHVLLHCSYARQVWALSGLPFKLYHQSERTEFEPWIANVRKNCDSREFVFLLVLTWFMWFSRNKFLWDNEDFPPIETVGLAKCFIDHHFGVISPHAHPYIPPAATSWHPPPANYIKINLDASIGNGQVGIGLVARDNLGTCVDWRFIKLKQPLEASCGEGLAMVLGLKMGIEKNWNKLVLESDCITVTRVNCSSSYCDALGIFVDEFRVLSKNIDSLVVNHVKREANKVAHRLAFLCRTDFNFRDSLPHCIMHLIIADSA